MLNITLACIGKLKESYLRDGVTEYVKRLTPYCKLNILELEESRMPDAPSDSQIASVLAEEGKRILSKIPATAHVIALCIEGSMIFSEDFGQYLNKITKRADFKLSLSRMTFTHQIARMLILEQLYRAFQINHKGKYHK